MQLEQRIQHLTFMNTLLVRVIASLKKDLGEDITKQILEAQIQELKN